MPLDFPNPSNSTTYTDPTSGNTYTYANGSWSLTSILSATKGGTGFASFNRGDILYGNASGTLSKLGAGTAGSVLSTQGSGADPIWIAMTASGGGAGTVATPGAQYQLAGYYSGTGSSVSGSSTFTNNTSTGIVSITHSTGSTSPSTGALLVSGGVGIAGTLSYFKSQIGVAGTTSLPSMAFIGNTNNPVYLNVLENNSLSFEGSQGQLLAISPDLNTGYVFTVGDISGIPLLRANANANVTANEFGGNFGIGTTNPLYKLEVNGQTAITGSTSSTSTSTGALIVTGGVGIGGSLNVGSLSKFSNHLEIRSGNELRLWRTADTNYTVLKSADVTGTRTFTLPLNVGSSGQFLTTDGAGVLSFTTDPVQVSSGSINQVAYYAAAGNTVSGSSSFTNDTSANKVSISHVTSSTTTSSGALVVTGGVGIGGSLYVGSGIAATNSASGDVVVTGGVGIGGSLRIGGTTASGSTTTGALTVAGGVGIAGALYVGSGIAATNSTIGDLVVTGGVGIGGSVKIADATDTGATNRGALVVTGGVGIGGGLYVGSSGSQFGGNLTIQGSLTMSAPLQAFNLTSPFKKINSISLSMSGNGFTNGAIIQVQQANIKETGVAASATVSAIVPAISFRKQSFSATNSGITYTRAATVYIEDAPDSSVTGASGAGTTNTVTITNPYALYVENGRNYMGGGLEAPGLYRCSIGLATDQTVTSGADALVNFTANSDPNGWWNATSKRLTPTIAGWYYVSYQVNWDAAVITNNQCNIQIRKNGSTFTIGQMQLLSGNAYSMSCSGMINVNGTSDYIDFTVYTANTTSQVLNGEASQQFTRADIFKIQ